VTSPNPVLQPLWFHSIEPSTDPSRRACELVAEAVAATFAIPLGELCATTRRQAAAAFARQSAMYLAHVVFGLTLTEVGRAFGRDRTTAAYACGRVENRRDDPAFDAILDALECACGSLRPSLSGRSARGT
jgi:chromosomal replication initiation ATPase DnaA